MVARRGGRSRSRDATVAVEPDALHLVRLGGDSPISARLRSARSTGSSRDRTRTDRRRCCRGRYQHRHRPDALAPNRFDWRYCIASGRDSSDWVVWTFKASPRLRSGTPCLGPEVSKVQREPFLLVTAICTRALGTKLAPLLMEKPPGIWRMSANRSAAQTVLSLIHQTLPRSLPCCDVPF
jgi:hypothetical protein